LHHIPVWDQISRPVAQFAVAKRKRRLQSILRLTNYLQLQTRAYGVDIIHSPVPAMPMFHWNTPLIITLHDVQELHYPQFFSPHERANRAVKNWLAIETTDKLVVSFQHVKDDLAQFFHISPEKIHVCPLPVSQNWLPNSHAHESSGVKEKYNLKEKFLLYPAQTWQHKNHIRLIQALAHLKGEGFAIPVLICTGKTTDFLHVIEEEITRNTVRAHIRFLGIVPEEDLVSLYKACEGVVIPTLYEAGSFPLIEAMMMGVPVICARTTSLPETIGDLQFTFDPLDHIDIANSLKLLLSDKNFRENNLANSQIRVVEMQNQQQSSIERFENLYLSIGNRKD
jgi:glycosyltransferase involved in cell wall biosynthesis